MIEEREVLFCILEFQKIFFVFQPRPSRRNKYTSLLSFLYTPSLFSTPKAQRMNTPLPLRVLSQHTACKKQNTQERKGRRKTIRFR